MIKRFTSDESGVFAIIGAIALIPLMLAVGMAVDIAMAMNMKTRLKQAADTAALVLAREKNEPTLAQAKTMAASMLDGNFRGQYTDLAVSKVGAEWEVSVNGQSLNNFMQIFAGKYTQVSAVSRAAHSTMSYEIALVLDTTGSMEGKKLTNLKAAATSMIATMTKDIVDKDKVKFSLVPFSNLVNVGPQFAPTTAKASSGVITQSGDGASWLDLKGVTTADSATIVPGVSRFQLFTHLGYSWKGCVESRQPTSSKSYDTMDLPPTSNDPRSLFVPALHIDDPDSGTVGNSYLDDTNSWNSVPSSLRPYMTKYGIPVKNGTLYAGQNWYKPSIDSTATTIYGNYRERKGPNFFCDSNPMVPLTNDYKKITDSVASLTALGNTNIFEGMMWGWRSLSASAPFTEGRPDGTFNNEKIVILLTDGTNAWNRLNNTLKSSYSSFGFLSYGRLTAAGSGDNTIVAKMDDKTLAACTNAKAAGITVYTIRLELDDSSSSKLLEACATDADHYFDVPDADALTQAFEEIRYRINRIRLTQ